MRKLLIIFMVIGTASLSFAQEGGNYYNRNSFLFSSSSVFQEGLLGGANPANLNLIERGDTKFFWSTKGPDAGSFKNWGFCSAVPNLGFGMQHYKTGEFSTTDYNFGIGFGSKMLSSGISYRWSRGDTDVFGREKILSYGIIFRPFNFVSLGVIENKSLQSRWNENVAELGLRPFSNSRLTLFADAFIERGMSFSEAPWSIGAITELAPGLNLIGRYFENESFTLGFSIDFGKTGLGGQSHYDSDNNNSGYSYYLRAGAWRESIFPELTQKNKLFLPLQLKGRVQYHKYAFMDNSIKFLDLLKAIRNAGADERVSVITLNLSGMRIYPEMAWEIREELKKVQQLGKKVIIFIDYAYMTSYYLASIADKVVLDPEGRMLLTGFASSKTYFNGTLAKLGLGFDEWRFMRYKSAAEILSRDQYSDADREQNQDYIDDRYENMRSDITYARAFNNDAFDRIINDELILLPEKALSENLVDTLGRWSDRHRIIWALTGKRHQAVGANDLLPKAFAETEWGGKPKIAIVYGLGTCDMDSGIKARWLEKVFLALARDPRIEAVVFRVDSPGGDGMASDLVATALRKCARAKPVIISQGQVAASGGYWISMYGTKILAGANSVTGSIGVIGGWIYDDGIGDKLGMTTDHVKRGEHADYTTGIRLPYLNLSIPYRNLNSKERDIIEKNILGMYDSFVKKVADGRNMSYDEVKAIAEGHFYSGLKGKEIGLVDEIGGLMTAVSIAMTEKGYSDFNDIELIEIPRYKGFFNLRSKISPYSLKLEEDDILEYIRMLTDNPGQPLHMLIPGTYPGYEK